MAGLVAYLDQITNARSVAGLWDQHTAFMRQYGFDRLLYGYSRYLSRKSFGDPDDWSVLSTFSQDYTDVFFDGGLYADAPMLNWAISNEGACSWRILEDMQKRKLLSEKAVRVLEFNRAMGITAGYTISFHSASARNKAAIGLVAPNGTSQDKVDRIWAQKGDEIFLANKVMHLKLLTLPHHGGQPLTKRQREVLEWVGDGKTTQDIAQVMDVTPATVEKHLRLARERLGVQTTAQAVLKAASQNRLYMTGPTGASRES